MISRGTVKVNLMQISWFSVSFVLSDPLLVKQKKMGIRSKHITGFGVQSYSGLELSFKVKDMGASSQILWLSLGFWAIVKIPT